MPSVEICLCEFGPSRGNNGDASLPVDRLEPSLSQFRRRFPDAAFTVWTDQPWMPRDGIETRRVEPLFSQAGSRYGNRMNDAFDAIALLQSTADIAIAVDSDLVVCSDAVRSIIPLALKFGLCMPSGGRHILWRDARSSCDGGPVSDDSLGCGMAHCTAFWAFHTRSEPHRRLLEAYVEQIQEDARNNCGARGPLSFWRATWKTGIFPYTLPREWCITGSNLGDVAIDGRPVPIVLHSGHTAVDVHYRELIEKANL